MDEMKRFCSALTILLFTFSLTLTSMTTNVAAIVSPSSISVHTSVYEKTLILTEEEVVDSEATQLYLLLNVGGAKVNLMQSTDEETIVKAVVRYSNERLEPTLTGVITDGKYIASFRSGHIARYKPGTVHKWNVTVGDTKLIRIWPLV